MRLEGKVAIVTAATRGIGLACVQRLAREGATVYIGARNMERAANRAEELNKEGCNVKTVYNDATEKETYLSMVEEVIKNEGKIDILVIILEPRIRRRTEISKQPSTKSISVRLIQTLPVYL